MFARSRGPFSIKYTSKRWEKPNSTDDNFEQIFDNGTSWSATYQWTAASTRVHGYPHVQFETQTLPIAVGRIGALNVNAQWLTAVASTVNSSVSDQESALKSAKVRSNVCLDMFLDPVAATSQSLDASIEIMIWFWRSRRIVPVGGSSNNFANTHQMVVNGMRL